MKRRIATMIVSGLVLGACSGPTTPAATEPAPAAEPPVTMPSAEPPALAPDARIGTINLMCGGESFRVAFLDTHAVLVSADGATTTELPILPPDANAAPGVTTYTNGMITFAKSGGGDTPTAIRYAKARMAFQDCAIAQN